MSTVMLMIATACLGLGFVLGRQREKPRGATCPRCEQQRLYYCRGCGHHFDEKDEAIDPREFDRMTAPAFRPDEVDS